MRDSPPLFSVEPSAVVGAPVSIGRGTKIWHFSHVMAGVTIGERCVIGQGCFIASGAIVGDGVKLQNNVSVFDGVTLEDDVFCGPGVVFTNVKNPRAAVSRRAEYRKIHVRRGATIGANATVLPGVTIGEYAFVGAGATVTRDVGAHALVVGSPARRVGWMSRNGQKLEFGSERCARCGATGEVYELTDGVVRWSATGSPAGR